MYQMLTGVLPYDTPSPADLDRLMRGELRDRRRGSKNPKIPKAINDIVLKAMAPEIHARYQRAGELLDDVLAARGSAAAATPRAAPAPRRSSRADDVAGHPDAAARRARRRSRASAGTAASRSTRASDRCPFCGEAQ